MPIAMTTAFGNQMEKKTENEIEAGSYTGS